MGIVGLHHVQVNIAAAQAEEAKRFYGEVLGLEQMERPSSLNEAGRDGVWYRLGEADELHLYFNPDPNIEKKRSSRHPAFLVDGLKGLRERLEKAGAELEEAIPIGGRERFFTRDPSGNRIEFLSFE